MMANRGCLAVLAVALLVLSGCYEDTMPDVYEPGEYKGSPDPLVEKLEKGDLQEQLRERVRVAGRDR